MCSCNKRRIRTYFGKSKENGTGYYAISECGIYVTDESIWDVGELRGGGGEGSGRVLQESGHRQSRKIVSCKKHWK